jgi:MerR family transcriptional regulator, mercuric resistance operon regulatory protein
MTTTTTIVSAGLTVSALADRVGVRPDTIRYYERIGLLPAAARTSGDHRRWPQATIDRLRFIQGCQRLGLSLAEIRDLLAVRDTGACPCEPAGPLLARHIADLDAEITRLTELRAELTAMHNRIGPDCPDPRPAPGDPADPPPAPSVRPTAPPPHPAASDASARAPTSAGPAAPRPTNHRSGCSPWPPHPRTSPPPAAPSRAGAG